MTRPDHNGNYIVQPPSLRFAAVLFNTGTTGGDLGWSRRAPTRAAADELVDEALAAPSLPTRMQMTTFISGDRAPTTTPHANSNASTLPCWRSTRRMTNAIRPGSESWSVRSGEMGENGSYYLIPASPETFGHGTTAFAKFDEAASRLSSESARIVECNVRACLHLI